MQITFGEKEITIYEGNLKLVFGYQNIIVFLDSGPIFGLLKSSMTYENFELSIDSHELTCRIKYISPTIQFEHFIRIDKEMAAGIKAELIKIRR